MPCATSELSIIQLPISSALGIGQLPPITPWECPLCWGGDLGSPFSSSADPAVQGPSWPRRGAVLWAGWHSANRGGKGCGTAGCQTSSEGSSFRLLLPEVTSWDCRLDLVPFRLHETALDSKSLSCPYQNGKGCAGAGCPSLACCSHSGGWGGAGWYM